MCDSGATSTASALEKSEVQLRSATVQPPPARRGCKPASHHEPSMIVHLPSNMALASSPFVSPPLCQYQPSADSHSQDTKTTTAAGAPTSNLWSPLSYRPANMNTMAFRATVARESKLLRHDTPSAEADRPLRDALPKSEPAGTEYNSKQVKSAISASSHRSAEGPATALAQHPSDSAFVAGKTASQVSHVCLLRLLSDINCHTLVAYTFFTFFQQNRFCSTSESDSAWCYTFSVVWFVSHLSVIWLSSVCHICTPYLYCSTDLNAIWQVTLDLLLFLQIFQDLFCEKCVEFIFTCESIYCFQRILAIAILSVCLSVHHMGGSVKNGAS